MTNDITSGLYPNFVFLFYLITPISRIYVDENSTALLKPQLHELAMFNLTGHSQSENYKASIKNPHFSHIKHF